MPSVGLTVAGLNPRPAGLQPEGFKEETLLMIASQARSVKKKKKLNKKKKKSDQFRKIVLPVCI